MRSTDLCVRLRFEVKLWVGLKFEVNPFCCLMFFGNVTAEIRFYPAVGYFKEISERLGNLNLKVRRWEGIPHAFINLSYLSILGFETPQIWSN